jgi:hypothetical protein
VSHFHTATALYEVTENFIGPVVEVLLVYDLVAGLAVSGKAESSVGLAGCRSLIWIVDGRIDSHQD